MNKLVLIGNMQNNTGPSAVLKNLRLYMEKVYQVYVIDTSSNDKFEKLKELAKVLKLAFQRDITINVHSFGYKIPYIIYIISKINHQNSYYLTLHGITSIENEIEQKEKNSQKKIEKKIINNFPNIICVSNFEKKILDKNFNRKKNVYVIENGSHLDNKKNSEKEDKEYCEFIMAGGFSRIKNTLEVIKLIKYLRDRQFKCKLKICGNIVSEDYYNECIQYIKINKLEQQIEYLGKIDSQQLNYSYQNANYIISFSKFDTFNLTILEGMQNRYTAHSHYY